LNTWTVRADRRVLDLTDLRAALEDLARGVEGLLVQHVSEDDFEDAPDAGAFRDFTPVATLSHEHDAVREYAAEPLIHDFGWRVDFKRR